MSFIDNLLLLFIVLWMLIFQVIKILTIDRYYKVVRLMNVGHNPYASVMVLGELIYLFGTITLLKSGFLDYGICLLVIQFATLVDKENFGRASKSHYLAGSLLSLLFLIGYIIKYGGNL